ncbi:corrinoid protein [Candidatus Hecatella orcuttiae]|uniref:cobalamin B12-binding domain-containing protein n=1 Tax=Candidatus Hecatella orcuttiae TaxID=1935119 RepID=UPI0028683581|nr:corrinoid protein [Candidatus Hecatella orcuttiae]
MSAETEILENLKKAIFEGNAGDARSLTLKAMEKKIDPLTVADVLTEAIRKVGEGFGRGELFIIDLSMAAEAMKNAVPIIEEEIKKAGKKQKTQGTVVIGTVAGDIHDIGKTMVSTLITAAGFEVIDLGVDIPAEKFLEAVRKYNPDILAMSSLMTITTPEQGKVLEALRREGLRDKVKVMVGGGAVTQEFAEGIGADGYAPTAPGAAELAKKLAGIE